ncbi:hypothetical protein JOD29_001657 [Lysinibacillus composti]|uniref:Uncharacterized protein n=1 Tax=Lysinibacillus composti TaxID=720633 RepID=A0A3N9UFA0_9BACI|nr:hypothetical protein [Lysinibacillus composti]MBM7608412.1 hypothetical protein [Lysinibacillus composti]RQW74913.1 hypothetical protein EBB45_08005 [Lysinibacillus composti]
MITETSSVISPIKAAATYINGTIFPYIQKSVYFVQNSGIIFPYITVINGNSALFQMITETSSLISPIKAAATYINGTIFPYIQKSVYFVRNNGIIFPYITVINGNSALFQMIKEPSSLISPIKAAATYINGTIFTYIQKYQYLVQNNGIIFPYITVINGN